MKRKIKSKAIILGHKPAPTLETVFKEHIKTPSLKTMVPRNKLQN